jgi:hypothetical protein
MPPDMARRRPQPTGGALNTITTSPLASVPAGDISGDLRRRRAAAGSLPRLDCGLCADPLACDLARWCPAWDGPRPEPRQRWECCGEFGPDGWRPHCQESGGA